MSASPTARRASIAVILAVGPGLRGSSPPVTSDFDAGGRVATPTEFFVPLGHAYPPTTSAWSPTGRLIATGAEDGGIIIWSEEAARELNRCGRVGVRVIDLGFTESGDALVAALGDGSIESWRTDGATLLATLLGHEGAVTAIAAGSNPDVGISWGQDGTLRAWSLASRSTVRMLEEGGDPIAALDVSPDGRLVAAASGTNETAAPSVRILRPNGGTVVRTLTPDTGTLSALSFSADGAFPLAAGASAIGVWRTDAWGPLGRYAARVEAACWIDAEHIVTPSGATLSWVSASRLQPGRFGGRFERDFLDFAARGDGTRFVA